MLASAFTLIFPLVGPAACILLALTLIGELRPHSRGDSLQINVHSHSSPVPDRLCVRTDTFTNGGTSTDLAAQTLRHYLGIPTSRPRLDLFESKALDSRRGAVRRGVVCRAVCRDILHVEDTSAGEEFVEQDYDRFAGDVCPICETYRTSGR